MSVHGVLLGMSEFKNMNIDEVVVSMGKHNLVLVSSKDDEDDVWMWVLGEEGDLLRFEEKHLEQGGIFRGSTDFGWRDLREVVAEVQRAGLFLLLK